MKRINNQRLKKIMRRFERRMARFMDLAKSEPVVGTLATADRHGRPSARTVLLKGVDERGFVFYTNRRSRKGRHLAENPYAALCFFWDPLNEQVCVEGRVSSVSGKDADRYWMTRPRESQLAAWASLQSQPLGNRAILLRRFERYRRLFRNRDVPRPPHWSGFRLLPARLEFWKRGDHRLHERRVFEKSRGWKSKLLYP